jgi:hypothetical protein
MTAEKQPPEKERTGCRHARAAMGALRKALDSGGQKEPEPAHISVSS